MTKKQFYNDTAVQDMANWMAERFDNTAVWKYKNFNNIHYAYSQYKWKNIDWESTKTELDVYRYNLCKALNNKNINNIIVTCNCILRWGGVDNGNIDYLYYRKSSIIDEFNKMKFLLHNNETPSKFDLSVPENAGKKYREYRMNAGFSKIYNLLCDYCIMYDSRVAAALCLLIKQFCCETKLATIPPYLKFTLPASKSNKRDPNKVAPISSNLSFDKIKYNDNLLYTEQVMQASWLLCLALQTNPNAFSKGEEGFHQLAAGLFMIGEDLS